MTDRTYFSETDARALVGRHVRARMAVSGAPAGTSGHVDGAKRTSAWGGNWVVNVTWEVPGGPWRFTRKISADDYERWVEEV